MSNSDQEDSGRQEPTRFEIKARPLGLKDGIDPNRINQLLDDLQVEEEARGLRRDFGDHPNP